MNLSDILAQQGIAAPKPAAARADLSPVDLDIDLLPHQVEARDFVLREHDVLLADDMGLGKTATAIAVVAAAQAQGLRTLIVVPPTLVTTWEREIDRFAPWINTATVKGTTVYGVPTTDVVIIANSVVLSKWQDALAAEAFDVLVADESHKFKTRGAGRTKALLTISKTISTVRLLMSGTPIPNGNHLELMPQVDILSRWGAFGGKGGFFANYLRKEGRFGWASINGVGLHQTLTSTFMLRRTRHDVLDLPNKGRTVVAVEGKGAAVRNYMKAHDDILAYLAEKQGGKVTRGQEMSQALLMMNVLRHQAGLMKVAGTVEHVKDLLADIPGGVFIVAENTDVIDGLVIGLAAFDPVVVDGKCSQAQKQEAIDAFTAGDTRVMIGQITAVAEGLTLHGDGRNTRVVVVQLPWAPASLLQAEDRLHRIGQVNDVEVEIMLAHLDNVWTIDERLWSMLDMKKFAVSTAIDGIEEGLIDGESVKSAVLDSYR